MNFNEVFKVRAVKKDEEDTYVITIGDRLASTEEFQGKILCSIGIESQYAKSTKLS